MSSRKCPVCGRLLTAEEMLAPHRPFCSLRCREIDLARWLREDYSIPLREERLFPPEHLPRDSTNENLDHNQLNDGA